METKVYEDGQSRRFQKAESLGYVRLEVGTVGAMLEHEKAQ